MTLSRSVPRRPPVYLLGLACALAVAAIPLGALLAQDAPAAFTVTESGQRFARLQQAVDAVGDRRGTIAIAPGRYAQCAVQQAGEIAFLATTPGTAIFDGTACEGKAALVLRGRAAQVSGLIFQNIRVPDFNGAGIRLERGNLTVAESWFRDSQQGILTAQDPAGEIIVDRTTFSRLGTCEGPGGCAHSIYVGDYGSLKVTRTRFEEGRGGHYLKTRAGRIEVAGSTFDDARGHVTNYLIDMPAGATGRIVNNWFVQGKDKENHSALITVAAEGKIHSSAGLVIADNDARMAPGADFPSTFVADWSGERLAIGQNTLGPRLKVTDSR